MDYFQWIDTYHVIECAGCENISFLNIYSDSEMIHYGDEGELEYGQTETLYPYFIEKGTELDSIYYLPGTIKNIYEETIKAFKAKAYILTAGGFRAIIEATCNDLKIRKDDLSKRIDLLHEKGFLSLNESKRLHSIRFLGNSALHEMEIPKQQQLLILLEIVNHLLENLYIHDKKIGDDLDTIIDKFEEFLTLTRNKISKDFVSKEMSLNEILGKSKILIKPADLKKFETKLIEEIEVTKSIDFLAVAKHGEKIIYKIEKMPVDAFDF
ncbi:MAG: DUF4145 domain-containing protein [Flavobacterium sp.]|nr:MAG: DUF4145 domain-containing protein [Flavobacterium sp.]